MVLGRLVQSVTEHFRVTPVRVLIVIEEDPEHPIVLRVREMANDVLFPRPASGLPAPSANGNGNGAARHLSDGDGLSPVVLDILKVLRRVKRPLSRTRILEELAKDGHIYSERTVAGHLARLVEDGTLLNPGRPKGGYTIPPEDAD
jgi:hypothetical protein